MKTPPRIKICCIASVSEAHAAIAAGADALGLVSAMPSGPGPIPEATIAEIARAVPPAIGTFLLTSETEAREIIRQQRVCRTNTLQLCDRVSTDTYEKLRTALPGVALVQVIHVEGPPALSDARAVAASVDAILLDSGRPNASIPELGGTGRVHDWTWSRAIRRSLRLPVFLAGGLGPHNVGEAIRMVQPFGVDLCSGVRTDGTLDERKLSAFIEAVHAACD